MEKKKKKRRRGHVAIPFLIALLLGILVIGGIAMFIIKSMDKEAPIQKMEGSVQRPTAENNFTVLFMLEEPKDPQPYTFLVARFLPEQKQVMFVAIPENTAAVVDGKQDTLTGFYQSGGMQKVKTALANEAGITVDRYMIMDSAAFQRLANIYAGAYYLIPAGTKGFSDNAQPQFLGPGQMEKLMTYPMFENGEAQRCVVVSELISEMIKQTNKERLITNMDTTFSTIVDMTVTDITASDYEIEKFALTYMFKYGNEGTIATFCIATGTEDAGGAFVLSDNFYRGIAEYFEDGSSLPVQEDVPADTAAADIPADVPADTAAEETISEEVPETAADAE